jgi:Heparinase II/III-like protein/Heparinase II/III N-terminus
MFLLKKIRLYFNTLKYLRWKQIFYRIFYFARHRWRKLLGFKYASELGQATSHALFLGASIDAFTSYHSNNEFCFLNLKHRFETKIDWEFSDYGKLWTYNLNYFDFLNQIADSKVISFESLLDDFINELPKLKTAMEPFPTSLRVINWIKYFSNKNIKNNKYDQSLYAQLNILVDNLEYHLLGNHLLENGFALLWGSVYFQDEVLFKTANRILSSELNEQILSDGAHFELCPMYHQIMLFRVLDCYNLMKNNSFLSLNYNVRVLETLLKDKASLMLGWLHNMTYANGSIPHFGDSADEIAPTTAQLFDYARRLDISPQMNPLSSSGYRKLTNERFELIAKVGQLGPDYIPGHAHADSLSFELRVDHTPFLVDTGISTYEKNAQRQLERSTESHNTISINGKNSSDVWGGFRVGKRASTKIIFEKEHSFCAEQTGYSPILHKRTFSIQNKSIEIVDVLDTNIEAQAFFHFHPNCLIVLKEDKVYFKDVTITFPNAIGIKSHNYNYAIGFNKLRQAAKIIVSFRGTLQTHIYVK